MHRRLLVALVLFVCPALQSAYGSTIPSLLNYQGVLKTAQGEIAPDGNYSVTFRIWSSPDGGVPIWEEGRLVTVEGGLFSVLLGSITPIPDSAFDSPNRWLGLQVGLDPEMLPRQRLLSVPYAWHASDADTAAVARYSQSVDTTGFSAYQDLQSEGRIGILSGQLALGDHTHEQGQLHIVEDTTTTAVGPVSGPSGDIVLGSVEIPAGDVGHFMTIKAVGKNYPWYNGSLSTRWRIEVDGVEVYSQQGALGQTTRLFEIELFKRTDSEGEAWIATCGSECYPLWRDISVVLVDGATITVTAKAVDAGTYEFACYGLIVEYDSH